MDVTSGGTTNGIKIQLYDCTGTGAQVWTPQPNGSLANPQSGRCLDDARDYHDASTRGGFCGEAAGGGEDPDGDQGVARVASGL